MDRNGFPRVSGRLRYYYLSIYYVIRRGAIDLKSAHAGDAARVQARCQTLSSSCAHSGPMSLLRGPYVYTKATRFLLEVCPIIV